MVGDIRRCREVADLVHGGVRLTSGAGGLHAVPGQVVMRGQRRVQWEAGAHTAQPGLVVSENINILDIPDQTRGQRLEGGCTWTARSCICPGTWPSTWPRGSPWWTCWWRGWRRGCGSHLSSWPGPDSAPPRTHRCTPGRTTGTDKSPPPEINDQPLNGHWCWWWCCIPDNFPHTDPGTWAQLPGSCLMVPPLWPGPGSGGAGEQGWPRETSTGTCF